MVIDYEKDGSPVLRFHKNGVEITISFSEIGNKDVKNNVMKILMSQYDEQVKTDKKS